ncbi:MAG: DJ-1/PfpI family protein [Pseudomonadota bacterium]
MTRTIGALVFPEFEMLDLYGPLEVFSFFPDHFTIRTVAPQAGAVAASGGPDTVAADSLHSAPAYDILLVPGGRGTRPLREDAGFLRALAAAAGRAQIVASVCTGALLLAKAGVLTGRRATTNKLAFDWVADQCPDVHWQARARWVVDAHYYTSSGVSAGMDMALALIEDLEGPQMATNAARYAEYIRNPDPDDDPFAVKEPT